MMMLPGDFVKDYERALGTQDWNIVEPLIHDDACVTFSNGDVNKGKEEIKLAYEKNFSVIQDEEYAISNVHWVRKTQEYAVYLFDFSWSGIINNELASGTGRGTTVLINENGYWKLLAEHLGPSS